MNQNNIDSVLSAHPLIPVVTINNANEIDGIISTLLSKGIKCIEVTLRTTFAPKALEIIKAEYSNEITLGVGTVISKKQVDIMESIGVDFIVNPGLSQSLCDYQHASKIPFIPGITTPSEIILGLESGCETLKFFPANLFGGIKALKTYGNVFPQVKFCPTGGINEDTFQEYLSLENVISVGGSWMMK
ncbi:MAG: bifunctional 4-hydroxy-2-oxoglutarate aldolase/2-dehydro-3-deoxy-phosphogluconate aldolase [Crocinitomicaceae bacterium]